MVILVEDDLSTREVICELLDNIGMQYCIASNSKEAIELLKLNNPSILLTDYLLGANNATEIVSYCKDIHPNCKSILITAIHPNKARSIAIEMGVNRLLVKPFNLWELENALIEFCN